MIVLMRACALSQGIQPDNWLVRVLEQGKGQVYYRLLRRAFLNRFSRFLRQIPSSPCGCDGDRQSSDDWMPFVQVDWLMKW
jgi:hypothetical protein